MPKTVLDAANELPESIRESFIELWKELTILDLYNGELEDYFKMAVQALQAKNHTIFQLQHKLADIKSVIERDNSNESRRKR
jgi:hypothetical protein